MQEPQPELSLLKELKQKLEQSERAVSEATASRASMQVERDAAISRAKEAEEVLEAKRAALADK